MTISVQAKRGHNGSPEELLENEIAWREFRTPNLARAVQNFALEVLEGALFGSPSDTELDGVRWILEMKDMEAVMLCGDYEVAIVSILDLIEIEIASREDIRVGTFGGYRDDSETYLAIANRFRTWAKRLEAAASEQERQLAAWGDKQRARYAESNP